MSESLSQFSVPRKQVGGYNIGGITFNLTRRPSWIARVLCHWLLDWRWQDAPSGAPK